MATLTMYDSVDVSTVPDNPQAVAGYTSGHWPTYAALVAKFPHAHHLSIAVGAGERARCLDIEPGDATNAEAPGWFRNVADHSQGRPIFYTSASNIQALVNTLSAAGIARGEYFIWSAHYTRTPHICGPGTCGYPQADLTQFTDTALGRNLDESVVQDYVFGVAPKPRPKPTPKPQPAPAPVGPGYDRFDNTPRTILFKKRTERGQVELYDKLRAQQTPNKHPHRLQLAFVRHVLKSFADRVYTVANDEKVNGKPSWDVDYRGWRYQELIKRAQGQRLV